MARVIIIIKSEVSTFLIVFIFFRGCVPQMFLTSYSVTYCIYISEKPGICFHYASAFRRRRHNVFGLSVRPSVQSPKYPLLSCTWVHWSTRPTVTVLRHVRPSVRLSVRPSGEVSGQLPENAWRDWPEILHADVSWSSSELIMAVVCWFF